MRGLPVTTTVKTPNLVVTVYGLNCTTMARSPVARSLGENDGAPPDSYQTNQRRTERLKPRVHTLTPGNFDVSYIQGIETIKQVNRINNLWL
jgi:hypothetical protein